jgi:hypothetical protein
VPRAHVAMLVLTSAMQIVDAGSRKKQRSTERRSAGSLRRDAMTEKQFALRKSDPRRVCSRRPTQLPMIEKGVKRDWDDV